MSPTTPGDMSAAWMLKKFTMRSRKPRICQATTRFRERFRRFAGPCNFLGTEEPGSDSTVAAFLNAFGRGDRDTNPRRSDGSVLQSLDMLNSPVLLDRIHQTDQGSHVAILLSQTSDPQTILTDLFLNTLSRPPTDQEIALYTPLFQQLGNQAAAENIQWVLLNKVDFLFNY